MYVKFSTSNVFVIYVKISALCPSDFRLRSSLSCEHHCPSPPTSSGIDFSAGFTCSSDYGRLAFILRRTCNHWGFRRFPQSNCSSLRSGKNRCRRTWWLLCLRCCRLCDLLPVALPKRCCVPCRSKMSFCYLICGNMLCGSVAAIVAILSLTTT